ncbi:MAG: PEP-CTERM sorting domain-containing protein [Sedimentisphaerales bacterium]|nr:PEP-CTERM sorting domain-containing protein [Sedimentisphaerales bacterium]
MKKLVVAVLVLLVCTGTAALATPIIEFSPDSVTGGSWEYDGAGTLSFNQNITVDAGAGSNADPLTGCLVYIPTLIVSGSGGYYDVKPLGSPNIMITNADKSAVYLMGTLGSGDLQTIGTVAGGYTSFTTDITDIVITDAGKALGSAALNSILYSMTSGLDFELSLNGGSGTNYLTFAEMLAGGYAGGNGFSGAMSIPEPATIAMLGLGALALLRKRRK